MSNQCEHGQLARVCSTCEFEREIETLRTELTLEREHSERLERRLELQQESANRYSARVAELDRLNTDLAMESHALQGRMAELEALVREVYLIEPSWGNDALMVERPCDEWLIDAHRLCPPPPPTGAWIDE